VTLYLNRPFIFLNNQFECSDGRTFQYLSDLFSFFVSSVDCFTLSQLVFIWFTKEIQILILNSELCKIYNVHLFLELASIFEVQAKLLCPPYKIDWILFNDSFEWYLLGLNDCIAPKLLFVEKT